MDKKRLQSLVQFLVEQTRPKRVYLFGSRTRGGYRYFSDVDLAVEGARPLTFREERKLREALDGLAGIWTVDLVFLEKVDRTLADWIRQHGSVLYERHEDGSAAGSTTSAAGF